MSGADGATKVIWIADFLPYDSGGGSDAMTT
jgi:hypothetical protein